MVPPWLGFSLLFIIVDALEISVQYNQANSQVKIEEGAWTPVTANATVGSVVFNSYTLTWFTLPNTGTPVATVNGSAIFNATTDFEFALLWNDLPYVIYQSPNHLGFICTKVFQTSHSNFNCSNSSVTAQFMAVGEWGLSQQLNISLTGVTSDSDPASLLLINLAIHRLAVSTNNAALSNQIGSSNDSRLAAARPVVGVLFFFIELGLFSLSILTAFWQTWLWPGFSFMANDDGCCRHRAFVIWTLFFFTVQQLVAWLGGFVGWIFIIVLQSVYALIVTLLYMSLYCTCCNNCCSVLSKWFCCTKCAETLDDNFARERQSDHIVNQTPSPLSPFQRGGIIVFLILTLLMGLIALIIFFTWNVHDYYVWDRNLQQSVVEYQPQEIARTVAIVYDYPGIAAKLQMNIFHKEQTVWCGVHYTEKLTTDSDKETIKTDWIDKYSIDMSIYARTDYKTYNSVNDWFTRTLNPNDTISHRPVSSPGNDKVIVSPADARVVVFDAVHPDTEVWIKGEVLSMSQLLGGNDSTSALYTNGTMAIVRLAPQDYHNFHAPVSGTVTNIYFIGGTLYSVNADAMRSDNGAIYNQRVIMWINTPSAGQVAFVAIGAACVGSVVIGPRIGDTITKGDNIGYFQFGGSTNVIVFQNGVVNWDADLLVHSQQSVESLVRVRQQIAIVN